MLPNTKIPVRTNDTLIKTTFRRHSLVALNRCPIGNEIIVERHIYSSVTINTVSLVFFYYTDKRRERREE